MVEPDVKTNETVGNITESLHDQLPNVEEETETDEIAVDVVIVEETLVEEALVDDVVDDSKLRKRRSGDMMDASTDATPRMSPEDMWAKYHSLVEKHKAIVDDITENCEGITVDNICTDFNWDGYIGKIGPPPPMGPPLCESCGKEDEVVETTVEPEETTAPVESTTTTVATTTTVETTTKTVVTTTTAAPTTTTTQEDVEPTSPATHEPVTEPCENDICDPCSEESFDMPPPPIPPMFPGANCTEKTDECATTAPPTTTEPVTETEPVTTTTETPPEPTEPPTTDPPTTQAQTTACPEADICCEDELFPPIIMPPPQLQCRSVCDKPDPCDVQSVCKEFIIQPNDECNLQSVHGNAQYNLWINRINHCTLYIDDEQLTGCEYGNKNGTTTLNNRATVCLDICNSVSNDTQKPYETNSEAY